MPLNAGIDGIVHFRPLPEFTWKPPWLPTVILQVTMVRCMGVFGVVGHAGSRDSRLHKGVEQ